MENYCLTTLENKGFQITERKPDNASYIESKYGVDKICFVVTFDLNKSHIIGFFCIISV